MATRKIKTTENAVQEEPATAEKPIPAKTTGQSQFSFLHGKVVFTTEPLWFKLVVITIIMAATIFLCSILGNSIASFSPKQTPQKNGISRTISKGRAP